MTRVQRWDESLAFDEAGRLLGIASRRVLAEGGRRRVELLRLEDGRELVEKVQRYPDRLIPFLKRLVARDPMRREAEAGIRLERAGLPAPRVLACGWRDDGDGPCAFLVREAWPEARSGAQLLPSLTPLEAPRAELPRGLAAAFGRWMAGLESAGGAHGDPHPGNLLIDGERVVLIDWRRLSFAAVSERRSEEALALLFQALGRRVSLRDRMRFLRALRPAAGARDRRALALRIADAGWQRSLRFERRRIRDAAKDSSPFRSCLRGQRRWQLREGEDLDAWEELLLAEEEGDHAVEVLKAGRSTTVYQSGDRVVKRFNDRRPTRRFLDRLRWGRARQSFARSWLLERQGVPALRYLGCAETRRGGLVRESYLFSRRLPLKATLEAELATASSSRREELLEGCALILASIHRLGFGHRDPKAGNFVVDERGVVTLMDLDGMRRRPRLSSARRGHEVERMVESLQRWAGVSDADAEVLRAAYARRWRRLHHGLKQES